MLLNNLIGSHFQNRLNTKTIFMNQGGHDLKATYYGKHVTFCNPDLTSGTCSCHFYENRRNVARKLISIYNKTCSPYQNK